MLLIESEVRSIIDRVVRGRHDYETIGADYGVTGRAVGLIATRQRWPKLNLDPQLEDRLALAVSRRSAMQGEDHPNALLTNDQVRRIRQLASDGIGTRELGRMFKVAQSTVQDIAARRSWRKP